MLALRRGFVLAAGDPGGPMQELDVRLGGDRRPAVADVALVGPCHVGDDVVVNVAAVDLELRPGGFDVVHVNLTRGLEGAGTPGAQAMKLGYTSLQHAVVPVEAGAPAGGPLVLPTGAPVAVTLLHGQLAPLAWAFAQAAPGARLGFVQTAGGALPGALGETVRLLRRRGLLSAHLTAGPADLDGYAAAALPVRAAGRSIEEDPEFFAAALAAGSVLAQCAA